MQWTHVVIIYNPKSTGKAKANAQELRRALRTESPKLPVALSPTKHAGHATGLAYQAAMDYPKPLIISASGDGGYNEVINGALQAQSEGAKPTCAVLPSGNANDHARTMQSRPLVELILSGSIMQLDVLKVDITKSGPRAQTRTRYAHSYVGIGVTSAVAHALDKNSNHSTPVEAMTLAQTIWKLRPVRLRTSNGTARYDSIVCGIIPEIAKVFTLSDQSEPDDGKFELTTIEHTRRPKLVYHILKGVLGNLGAHSRVADFNCTVLQSSRIQFDGEVIRLAKNTKLAITICPNLLRTVAEVSPRPKAAKRRASKAIRNPQLTSPLRHSHRA